MEVVQEESEGRCPHESTVERILEEDLTLAGRRLSTAGPQVELNHVHLTQIQFHRFAETMTALVAIYYKKKQNNFGHQDL